MNFGVYQALTKSRPFRMIRNMDNEINEWLEHEYSAFERQFFSHCRVWRLPVQVLKGTDLYRLFETFSRTFPDHPSDVNTVFYLIEPTKPDSVIQYLSLWCSHFEHSGLEDLRNLVSFLDDANHLLSRSPDSAGVSLLDCQREWVVLTI